MHPNNILNYTKSEAFSFPPLHPDLFHQTSGHAIFHGTHLPFGEGYRRRRQRSIKVDDGERRSSSRATYRPPPPRTGRPLTTRSANGIFCPVAGLKTRLRSRRGGRGSVLRDLRVFHNKSLRACSLQRRNGETCYQLCLTECSTAPPQNRPVRSIVGRVGRRASEGRRDWATYEISPNGAKASRSVCVSISGLRSPTNM